MRAICRYARAVKAYATRTDDSDEIAEPLCLEMDAALHDVAKAPCPNDAVGKLAFLARETKLTPDADIYALIT